MKGMQCLSGFHVDMRRAEGGGHPHSGEYGIQVWGRTVGEDHLKSQIHDNFRSCVKVLNMFMRSKSRGGWETESLGTT